MVSYLKENCVNLIEIDVGRLPKPKVQQYLDESKKSIRAALDEMGKEDIKFILVAKGS